MLRILHLILSSLVKKRNKSKKSASSLTVILALAWLYDNPFLKKRFLISCFKLNEMVYHTNTSFLYPLYTDYCASRKNISKLAFQVLTYPFFNLKVFLFVSPYGVSPAVYQRFSSSIPAARLMRKGLGDWYLIVPGTDDTWKGSIHIG